MTNSLEGGSHFGVHFSPILLSLIPFYAIVQEPQTLLILQTILLSLGVIPIYLFGRETLGKGIGCIIGLLYLIYPAIYGVNLYDFHEVAFLPFLLGMALWSFLTERKNMLLFFCFLSLLVKEDITLIIMMISLTGLYQTRKESISDRWQYIVLTIGSVAILITFLMVIRPLLISPGTPMISGFLTQYYDLFSNLSQHNDARLSYFLMIFLPLLFLPFGSPTVMAIGIPSFLEIFLSPVPYYYSINNQYSALIITVVFMATIRTLYRIRESKNTWSKLLYIPIICLIIISSIICSGMYSLAASDVYLTKKVNTQAFEEHRNYLNRIISLIPDETSISTQHNLLPLVSKRKTIWSDYNENADIILVDTTFPQRAAIFNDDMQKIETNFHLLSNKEGLFIFVNKKNENLLSELTRECNFSDE